MVFTFVPCFLTDYKKNGKAILLNSGKISVPLCSQNLEEQVNK